jgi:hypothetical protein
MKLSYQIAVVINVNVDVTLIGFAGIRPMKFNTPTLAFEVLLQPLFEHTGIAKRSGLRPERLA